MTAKKKETVTEYYFMILQCNVVEGISGTTECCFVRAKTYLIHMKTSG